MAYISLYRKYRPQNFEDVVGQDHITRTLKNAIREGRLASGYLFCGTRGTAKTTCARILAKALNCIGPDGTLTSPTPEPCGVCGPCKAIAASSFVDVIEMDAASHRGIDDMREIVSSIKFPPMEGRYKVYIIDEAHQLTNDAKDAFLKTLEEPPDRVLFILATTDQDKMPITIQSRCQVFEFKRGTVAQIGARVSEVLASEGVRADPSAVAMIARAADGSYRDSLSLLEQVLAYQRENVTPADVSMVLGTVDEEVLTRVVSLVADSDAAGAFALAGQILESGKDVRQFLKTLSMRFRDMLFLGVGADRQAAWEGAAGQEIRAQAARFSPAALLQALEALTEAEREMRTNNQHRLLLEMALLRLMRLPSSPAIVSVPAAVERPAAEPSAPAAAFLSLSENEPEESEQEENEPEESLILVSLEEDIPEETAEQFPEEESLFTPPPAPKAPLAPPPSSPEPQTVTPVTAPVEDHDATLNRLQRSWQEVINRVSSVRPAAVSLIKDARPTALSGSLLTLDLSSRFYVDRLTSNVAGRQMIEDQINRTLGVPEGTYRVRGVLRESETVLHSSPERVRETPASTPHLPPPSSQASLDPLMDEVIAVFGGRIEEDDWKG